MKYLLLFNLILGGLHAEVVTSERFLLKILDRTISLRDIKYLLRNLKGLDCVYEDSFIVRYFDKSFLKELEKILQNFPSQDLEARLYLQKNEDLFKKIRFFFKILRYSEDQKTDVSSDLSKLIRQSVRENKCQTDILYKDSLKTNFLNLLEVELYLRSRYGGQLKNSSEFEAVGQSIDLLIESLDKQFQHEYYW